MEKLLWAVGGAAAVYVLYVVPLKRQLATASSGDAARETVGAAAPTIAAMKKTGGCGCGGK